jgi:uridylate kinase
MELRYKRILLKLSGEALMGQKEFGISTDVLQFVAGEVRQVWEAGVQIGLVVGGGNIYRGIEASKQGIDKVTGDHMGMLATVINSLALQNALEAAELPTRLQTAIKMEQIAEPFIRRRAVRHLEKNRIVIFGAGTGNPYFTTDTAAALRAIEINADVIIKGTRVDGVYDADPLKNPSAQRFQQLTYKDVLERDLRVMDMTAITLSQENTLPILVYDMSVPGSLLRLVAGEDVGTLVH